MFTLNWGERDVDAGTAAMLVNIGPILVALLGGWLLHEGFPRRLAAGQFVSRLGSAPVSAALNVVYLRLFPTTLGFTTWAYALARATAGRMAPRSARYRSWSSSCRGSSWARCRAGSPSAAESSAWPGPPYRVPGCSGLAEADGNRTRQRCSAALTSFEDWGDHQAPRRLRVDSTGLGGTHP